MLFLPETTVTFFMIATLLLGISLDTHQRGTFSIIMTMIMLFIILCEFAINPTSSQTWQGWQMDPLSQTIKIFASTLLFLVLMINLTYLRKCKIKLFEYGLLIQATLLGVFVICSANNFLILFIGLELSALPMYAIIALFHNRLGLEAAIKYFILGALASGFILFGMSLCFGASGSIIFAIDEQSKLSVLGMLFITCGLLFKLGCAPFHSWVPDIYEGAPLPALSIIATIPKLAYVVVLVRLGQNAIFSGHLQYILIICSILSMCVGNLAALSQTNTKRLLGYSSVAHMGYVVLAISMSTNGFPAALFYVILYTIATAGILGILTNLSKPHKELNLLNDLKGMHHKHPLLALSMLAIIFSMAAIPPLGGFIAKLNILYALYLSNYIKVGIIAMLIAVIGIFYYIHIIRLLYFDGAQEPTHPMLSKATIHPLFLTILITPAFFILFNGIAPNLLMNKMEKILPTRLTTNNLYAQKKHTPNMDIEEIFKFPS